MDLPGDDHRSRQRPFLAEDIGCLRISFGRLHFHTHRGRPDPDDVPALGQGAVRGTGRGIPEFAHPGPFVGAELAYRPSHLEQIGAVVTEYLEQARKTGSTEPIDPPNWLKTVHREARKKHDQARLSAATLAIIYLRAQKLEEDGAPVCQNIDSYLLKWQSEPSLSGTAEIDPETPP